MPEIAIDERHQHAWNVSPAEAVAIQERLRCHLVTENQLGQAQVVAGVDVGFPDRNTARAAVVSLLFPSLTPIDYSVAAVPVQFPYIPGLLAFREVPAVLAAVRDLRNLPDLFIYDAQGFAHPRRMGLASHAGLLLDRPSIGCAKSRLVGQYQEPGSERGARSPLMDGDECVGAVVRTRANVKPVFVSIGHRVDLDVAVRYVIDCAPKYRLPQTTRYAHRVASGQEIEINLSSEDKGQQLTLL